MESTLDLQELAERYDRAKSSGERDQIAEVTYALIGGRIKSMIKRIGRGLGADDLDGFAREATVEALENSGVTRIKRSDGTWENFVQRHKNGHPVTMRIWDMLTPDLRKNLESALYLKATTADQLVRALNVLIRRRDFYDAAAWVGVLLPGEARHLFDKGLPSLSLTELSRFNAIALGCCLPGNKHPD